VRVAVTGATGTIGQALVRALRERGDSVSVLARDPERARRTLGEGVEAHRWADATAGPPPAEALAGRDAVVHLAGEPVAQRWTRAARERIRDTRVLGTRHLVEGIRAARPRPRILVSQSASGYYGPRGDEPVDESEPSGDPDDFLAGVCREWEAEAIAAEDLPLRVVRPRTGVVLSARGGALARMLPPFRMGVGGPVAGGRQHVPWIHVDDVVGAILLFLGDERATGPVNLAAPAPATNRDLSRALGRVLRRPAVAPVPALALRLLYGRMAEIVTTGVRLEPRRLRELGYEFRHADLEAALRDVLGAARR
jgi:uncharacterized protein